jgi:hypothetical protein
MPLTKDSAARKDQRTGIAEMQHRHFATVATIIARLDGTMTTADRQTVAEHFAWELAATNPKFDKARFLTACGVQ